MKSKRTALTLGHSNRSLDEFLEILKEYRVEAVADVRHFPGSKKFPHFNKESLEKSLRKAGIEYHHFPGLGGRRKPLVDSRNTGWITSAFRGFADYMQTDEFEKALKKLERLIQKNRVAIMCAEAVPWRCHRSLIADALMVRGITVYSIFSRTQIKKQKRTAFARVRRTRIVYPATVSRRISTARKAA